ncbi:hypothetical protein GH714_035428 [Hevea brasiliensis]|uniref:Isochorismatase-like domain-containing protein n=1 Tax=Hevea brasiliensis TaxID=3981 RepID=A0A6A6NE98_HEVBR|nr:hypothetical protein GH714_035428 [Hevea brasiliensis]
MADKWKQTALLVIDMQNDFIREDGLMRVDGGKAIVPNVIKVVEIARQRGVLVVWVVREHDSLGRDVELFRQHLYSAGKVGPTSKGSKGAKLVDGLVMKERDYKVVKTRFSAFFNTHLHSFLQTEGIKSLVIVGVQTPNCIRQTVFDAVALDYANVSVIVDATAAATPDVHVGWIESRWRESHCPNVIKAVEIARQRGILVIWVVRENDSLGRDVELFRRHMYSAGKVGPASKGSKGAELVDGLMMKERDYKVVKTRFSAFFNTHLHSFLQTEGIKSLVIVGVQTPNCIRQTVFDAVGLDYANVSVIVDATAAATPDVHVGMFS